MTGCLGRKLCKIFITKQECVWKEGEEWDGMVHALNKILFLSSDPVGTVAVGEALIYMVTLGARPTPGLSSCDSE